MAVYCGVCAERLDGAWENYGSFLVSTKFINGWASNEKTGKPIISDTCENCAIALADAIAKAATTIANKHKARITSLKTEVAVDRKRQQRAAKERQELEAAWAARPTHSMDCDRTPGTGCICGAGVGTPGARK
jgi:hypothetical protein